MVFEPGGKGKMVLMSRREIVKNHINKPFIRDGLFNKFASIAKTPINVIFSKTTGRYIGTQHSQIRTSPLRAKRKMEKKIIGKIILVIQV